ncbi:hypothetical protein Droror1_Dr00014398 [Drosera rotundifolia]
MYCREVIWPRKLGMVEFMLAPQMLREEANSSSIRVTLYRPTSTTVGGQVEGKHQVGCVAHGFLDIQERFIVAKMAGLHKSSKT